MFQKLFSVASCAVLALAVPASAQRMAARIPVAGGMIPVAAPAALTAAPTASGPALSAPGLAPVPAAPSLTLAAPAPAAALPAAVLPAAAPALAASFAAAASAPAPERDAPGAPLAALRGAARGETPAAPASSAGRVFDGSDPMRRPLVEGWTVEGTEYSSTRDLALRLPNLPAPVPATYRFSHEGKPLPKARAANTAVGFASGAAIGALAGGLLFVFGSLVGPFIDLFLGGRGAGPALSELGLFAGMIGGFGAAIGAVIGFDESGRPRDESERIAGTIYRHAGPRGETLYFSTERGGGKVLVDLGAYALAEPISEPAAPEPGPAWKRAAAGLAGGAALAVSQWVPLLQVLTLPLAGPAVGAEVGRALAGRTGVAGGWLGGSLGLLVPVAAFVSFAAAGSVGILAAFGGYVAALAAAGLVVGLFAANPLRAQAVRDAARAPSDQWWGAAKGR